MLLEKRLKLLANKYANWLKSNTKVYNLNIFSSNSITDEILANREALREGASRLCLQFMVYRTNRKNQYNRNKRS
jgi:hypothetical protein